jgi:hypothetical protein
LPRASSTADAARDISVVPYTTLPDTGISISIPLPSALSAVTEVPENENHEAEGVQEKGSESVATTLLPS